MEAPDIINLWKSYDHKLEESLSLNRRIAADITNIKVRSFLSSMKPIKIFTIFCGMAWVIFVDMVIIQSWTYASVYFLVSAIIQVLLTKIAIGTYIYQLTLIEQCQMDESVIETQARLGILKSSTLWVTRLLFLQCPVWTTFFWSERMIAGANAGWLVFMFFVTGLFTFFALWLFFNIKYENRHKKWFHLIFSGKEWTPLMKSMDLLEQVADYR